MADYQEWQDPGVGYGSSQQPGTLYANPVAAPPKQAAPGKGKGKTPAHVALAAKAFGELFPKETAVKFFDFREAPSKYIRADADRRPDAEEEANRTIWAAWTNSSTKMYISENTSLAKYKLADMKELVRHEWEHILQFRGGVKIGGQATPVGPPSTYEQMVTYEVDAYGKDVGRGVESSKQPLADMQGILSSAPKGKGVSPKAREAWILQELKDDHSLPPDAPETPGPLYRSP